MHQLLARMFAAFWFLVVGYCLSACQTSNPSLGDPEVGRIEVLSAPDSGKGVDRPAPALGGPSDKPAAESGAQQSPPDKFGCRRDDECASTCDSGCVSLDFAAKHQDTCVNIRAFSCTCVQNVCNTDGRAPSLNR